MTLEEIKEIFKNDRFATELGCEIVSASSGHAVVSFTVDDNKHLNGNNVVQGGAIFTLADFACAVAANSDELAYVSADGNISYLNAGTGKRLIAHADVIRKGKTLSFCEALIIDETERLIAKACFTMCRVRQ